MDESNEQHVQLAALLRLDVKLEECLLAQHVGRLPSCTCNFLSFTKARVYNSLNNFTSTHFSIYSVQPSK